MERKIERRERISPASVPQGTFYLICNSNRSHSRNGEEKKRACVRQLLVCVRAVDARGGKKRSTSGEKGRRIDVTKREDESRVVDVVPLARGVKTQSPESVYRGYTCKLISLPATSAGDSSLDSFFL